MGIETTDPDVLDAVGKRSTPRDDMTACRLLRERGIRSIIGHIVGLGDETWRDFRRARRALTRYDGDLLNAMYVMPHAWTRYARECAGRPLVQEDQRRWVYRHQVLGQSRMRPWQLFAAVKWLELAFHMRWGRILRLLRERDPVLRRQLRWTMRHTTAVWLAEIAEFVLRVRFAGRPRPLGWWVRRWGFDDGTVHLGVGRRPKCRRARRCENAAASGTG